MKNNREIKKIIIALLLFLAGFAEAQIWTGKYSLVLDPTDQNVFYLQIVPDNSSTTYNIRGGGGGTTAYIVAPAGFTYTAVGVNGTTWNFVNFNIASCNVRAIQCSLQTNYPAAGVASNFQAGVPITLAKFTTTGCGLQGTRLMVSKDLGGDSCPVLANLNQALVLDDTINGSSFSGAYSGNITTGNYPLMCPTALAVDGTQSIAPGNTGNSVLDNDTIGGLNAASSAASTGNVTLTVNSASSPNVTLNPATGLVTVASGTPAGTYTVNYTICRKDYTTVCSTATETVTVTPVSCTFTNSGTWAFSGTTATTTISGITTTISSVQSGTNPTNVTTLSNDTFNMTNFWDPSTIAGKTSLSFVSNWDTTPLQGEQASVDGGTRIFTIAFSRPIKEFKLHVDRLGGIDGGTSNSSEWTLTSPNVTMTRVSGNTPFIVSGNKFYRTPNVPVSTVNASEASNTPGVGTAAGTLAFSDTSGNGFSSLTFSVQGIGADGNGGDGIEFIMQLCANTVIAADDAGTLYNGNAGTAYTTPNILLNDTHAGVAATTANVSLSQVGTWPAGITLNTNGTINVASTVPAGTYNVPYQICSKTDTSTCDTAIVTIVVGSALPCYNPAFTGGSGVDTKHGITLLKRAGTDNGNWPMIRKSAHTVMESNTKGFVITRVPTSGLSAITDPVEGMMVYDTTEQCLKINTDGTTTGWKCFQTPTCP